MQWENIFSNKQIRNKEAFLCISVFARALTLEKQYNGRNILYVGHMSIKSERMGVIFKV